MHRRLHLVGGGAELPGAQFVDIADELALISRVRGLAAEVVGPVENAGRARRAVLHGGAPDHFPHGR